MDHGTGDLRVSGVANTGDGMSNPALDGGEAVLQAARDLGVDYIFSSAGSEWAPVWEALSRQDAARAAGPPCIRARIST